MILLQLFIESGRYQKCHRRETSSLAAPAGTITAGGFSCAVNQAATQPPETIEAHGRQPMGFLLAPALCPSVPFASRQERVCDRSSEERDEQAGKKESSAPLLITPAGASRADFDRSPMLGAICGRLPQAGQILLGIGRRAAAVVTGVDRRFGNREHGGSPRRLSASPWQDALGGAGGNSSFAAGVAARKTIPHFFRRAYPPSRLPTYPSGRPRSHNAAAHASSPSPRNPALIHITEATDKAIRVALTRHQPAIVA